MLSVAQKICLGMYSILNEVVVSFIPSSISSVVQWLFRNDSSGVTFNSSRPYELESSIGNHDGVPREGACVDFDGVDDLIDCGDILNPGTGDFSVSCWIKMPSTVSDGGVVSKFHSSDNEGWSLFSSSGFARATFKSGGTSINTVTSDAIDDGNWHHLAATFDRDGNMTCYVDGVVSSAVDISSHSAVNITNSRSFEMGHYYNFSNRNLDGKVADVRYFSSLLNSDNITYLNSRGSSGNNPGTPDGWWQLNEESGDICPDSSGNNYHGLATNVTLTTFRVIDNLLPVNNANIVGWSGVRYFDGSNSYIDYSSDSIDLNNTDFTIFLRAIGSASFSNNTLFDTRGSGSPGGAQGVRVIASTQTSLKDVIIEDGSGNYIEFQQAGSVPSFLESFRSIMITFDSSSGTGRLYVDGSLEDTETNSSLIGANFNTSNILRVGARTSSINQHWEGLIGDVRVYQEDLNSSASSLHNDTYNSTTPAFWAQFKDDNVEDYSGNNKHGSNFNSSYAVMPRSESSVTNSIAGSSLHFSGLVKHTTKLNSPCLTFDGIDDYVSFGDIPFSRTTFSVFASIKTSSSSFQFVVSQYITGGNQRAFFLAVGSTGLVEVLISSDGQYSNASKYYKGTTVVDDGVLHTIGFTWNSGTLKLYVDGEEETVTKTDDDAITQVHDSTASINLGGASSYFDGEMYDFIMTEDVLTSSEVSGLPESLSTISNILIHTPMQEGYGDWAGDVSGNSNHGTLNNFTLSSAWANNQQTSHYALKNGHNKRFQLKSQRDYISLASSYSESGVQTVRVVRYLPTTISGRAEYVLSNGSTYALFFESNSKIYIRFTASSSSSYLGLTIPQQGILDIVFTWNGTQTELFINGVSQGNITPSGFGSFDFDNICEDSTSSRTSKDGYLLQCATWNEVLDDDEILELYNSGDILLPDSDSGDYDSSANLTHLWHDLDDWKDTASSSPVVATPTSGTGSVKYSNVPLIIGDTVDTSGQTVRHTAGKKHNNSLTTVEQYSSPQMREADDLTDEVWFTELTGAPKQVAFDDLPTDSTSDQVFSDQDTNNNIHDVLTFNETLTGSELSDVESYTNN